MLNVGLECCCCCVPVVVTTATHDPVYRGVGVVEVQGGVVPADTHLDRYRLVHRSGTGWYTGLVQARIHVHARIQVWYRLVYRYSISTANYLLPHLLPASEVHHLHGAAGLPLAVATSAGAMSSSSLPLLVLSSSSLSSAAASSSSSIASSTAYPLPDTKNSC